jgi:hypothetical protein
MPTLARTKELPSENLSLEEQIQTRAYELYVSAVTNQARNSTTGFKPKRKF